MIRGRMKGSHYEYYRMAQKNKPQTIGDRKSALQISANPIQERVKEVTRANRKPSKLKWTDLPEGVLKLLKELGVYPKKKSYGKNK